MTRPTVKQKGGVKQNRAPFSSSSPGPAHRHTLPDSLAEDEFWGCPRLPLPTSVNLTWRLACAFYGLSFWDPCSEGNRLLGYELA